MPGEVTFAGITCALLVIPLVVLYRGYARTRNRRMLVCALAISAYFLTDLYLLAAHLGWLPGAHETELIEFVGDVSTAFLLMLAFTLPMRAEASA